MSKVAVIDYGVGNILSVQRGLEQCGVKVVVTNNADEILSATHVVLPGVGSFVDGMSELHRLNLDSVVREVVNKKIPLLGICLGMQMLLDESDEFGITAGLGLISGRVIVIPTLMFDGQLLKIPHIGWSKLVPMESQNSWDGTLLQGINQDDSVYFVHSYMANPKNINHRLANCNYGNESISAVIQNKNVYGCQFHPEKSGDVGLKILKNFMLL